MSSARNAFSQMDACDSCRDTRAGGDAAAGGTRPLGSSKPGSKSGSKSSSAKSWLILSSLLTSC